MPFEAKNPHHYPIWQLASKEEEAGVGDSIQRNHNLCAHSAFRPLVGHRFTKATIFRGRVPYLSPVELTVGGAVGVDVADNTEVKLGSDGWILNVTPGQPC